MTDKTTVELSAGDLSNLVEALEFHEEALEDQLQDPTQSNLKTHIGLKLESMRVLRVLLEARLAEISPESP